MDEIPDIGGAGFMLVLPDPAPAHIQPRSDPNTVMEMVAAINLRLKKERERKATA